MLAAMDRLGTLDRRRALRWTGVATAALFVVLVLVDRAIEASGGPGIVAFELAGSTDRVAEILGHWGQDGRAAARVSLGLDFLFLVAYATFLTLAVLELRDVGRRRGWTAYARPATAIAFLPAVAAACDVVENLALLAMVQGEGTGRLPPTATAFASAKFAALAIVVVYLLAGLAALANARNRRTAA
jgi:hypothetical protein